MNLVGTGMHYYGRKTEANLLNTISLLPAKPIDCVVDCCFGSGNFSRLVGTQIGCERVIGYEKEIALYTLHMQIQIRKKKAEVVYVNYDPINDFWHTKYDVSDL